MKIRHIIRLRIFTQFAFFVIFSLSLTLLSLPLFEKTASYIFNADPLNPFFVSISERLFLPALSIAALIFVSVFILGRYYCGWICPMGTMIDISGMIRAKLKIKFKPEGLSKLRPVKYILLAIIVIFALFGQQLYWIFSPLSAAGRMLSVNIIPLFNNTVSVFNNSIAVRYYPGSYFFLIYLSFFLLTVVFAERFWCRYVCPLGAAFSVFSGKSPLVRKVEQSCNNCLVCGNKCRMAAINGDGSYNRSECILCLDCLDSCKTRSLSFGFSSKLPKAADRSKRIFIGILAMPLLSSLTAFRRRKRAQQRSLYSSDAIIRPPGSIEEPKFKNKCLRCFNCINVCVTNGLQPVLFEKGISSFMTPKLATEFGYCEYDCKKCTEVCPTSAILKIGLDEKKNIRLGRAFVDQALCRAWKGEEQCMECMNNCPLEEKAVFPVENVIAGEVFLSPRVDKGLCIGCGRCSYFCPVRPERAIKVDAVYADRS